MAGILYIVPTPVGNLEDFTYRAARILREADLVLAEDTRTTSVLLQHYGIHVPLQSHHKFNEHQTVEKIKELILLGRNVALVSDAGTPGISDPGFLIDGTVSLVLNKPEKGTSPKVVFTNNPKVCRSR